MTDEIFRQLASTGVVGTILVLTLFALRDKDRQLKAEMAARLADSEKYVAALKAEMTARTEDAAKYNALAMSLQREVIAAVSKLGEMLELWERREEALEREKRSPPLRGGTR